MKVAIREEEGVVQDVRPAPARAWAALGWFGLLLALIGLGDLSTNWYPFGLGSAEWEFVTVATSLGSLPLVTMGFAAMLASFMARGIRWGIITMSVVLLVMAILIVSAYVLFLTDVPLALKGTAGTPVALGIRRTIVKTTLMGPGFGVGYLVAAVASLRSLRRRAQ